MATANINKMKDTHYTPFGIIDYNAIKSKFPDTQNNYVFEYDDTIDTTIDTLILKKLNSANLLKKTNIILTDNYNNALNFAIVNKIVKSINKGTLKTQFDTTPVCTSKSCIPKTAQASTPAPQNCSINFSDLSALPCTAAAGGRKRKSHKK